MLLEGNHVHIEDITMGGIVIKNQGGFKKTLAYMFKASRVLKDTNRDVYGQRGVNALQEATPSDSGETADSWHYEIVREKFSVKIVWTNDKTVGDTHVPLAVLLQYGHADKSGAWVEGLDYINPALRPIFEDIASKIWKEASEP